ncbi:MAG: GntR family transcriptional regulator [Nevskiales bacterium]|nr:GntR family transcriptional regulator [Nevskiales bacterium]
MNARAGLSAVKIADRIKVLIERKTFQPGDRLKELDLVKRFDSSRSPVREALRILEAKGLVKIEANVGATVARLTEGELDELLDMRGTMLRVAARRAVERATPEDCTLIVRLAKQLEGFARNTETAVLADAQVDFVRTLLRIGRSRRIAKFLSETTPALPHGRRTTELVAQSPDELAGHFARIADAITRRDADLVERVVGEFYAIQARLVKRFYRQFG